MEKISFRTKISFALGGMGKDMMFAMSTVMLYYFTDLLLINAAFIGIMMMVVRVWDAVNDPIMGTIVERTESRWGKFRPWILIGTVLNAVVLVVLFTNPGFATNSALQKIFVTLLYTLWGMTYTLMDIPFWSMIPSLSSSQKERESITILTRLFTSIGYFIIAAGYVSISKILGGGEAISNEIVGLFYLSIIVAVIFIATEIVTVSNVKEKIMVKEPKKTVRDMFELLKQNDQLLVVMIVVLIINFTLYITSGVAIYYMTYSIGDADLFVLFMAAAGVLQVFGSLAYGIVSKKLKRKQIYNVAIFLQLGGFILLFVNAFFLGNSVALLFAFGAPIFFGQGMFMVLQTVMLSDTVEYGELKTGKRSEALAFSVQTFVVKLAMGLSLGVIGVGLTIIKFVQPVEDVNTGEVIRAVQSTATLNGMSLMMFILPIFGLIVGQYIFNKKHILTEEKYEEILAELKVKRGESNGENTI